MVTIRRAVADDLEAVRGLYAQLNPDDPTVDESRAAAAFNAMVSSLDLYVFLATHDRLPVATCYLNVIPNLTRGVSPYGIIENVVTDRDFRNRGYGKAVIDHALAVAWDRGCYKVMLQTGSRRESTHRFYLNCGFRADEKFAFVARPPSDDVPD